MSLLSTEELNNVQGQKGCRFLIRQWLSSTKRGSTFSMSCPLCLPISPAWLRSCVFQKKVERLFLPLSAFSFLFQHYRRLFFHPRNFLRVSLCCFYFNRPKVFPWSLFVLFCCLGQAFPVECSHKSISWWKEVCLEWTRETTESINSSAFGTNDCPEKPSAAQQHLSQIPNTCISS